MNSNTNGLQHELQFNDTPGNISDFCGSCFILCTDSSMVCGLPSNILPNMKQQYHCETIDSRSCDNNVRSCDMHVIYSPLPATKIKSPVKRQEGSPRNMYTTWPVFQSVGKKRVITWLHVRPSCCVDNELLFIQREALVLTVYLLTCSVSRCQ